MHAVEHHDRPAGLVERAGAQLGEPLRGRRHEPPRDRRLRRRPARRLDGLTDGFERDRILPGRDAGQHLPGDLLGQQVGVGERRIRAQRRLGGLVTDGAHAWAGDRQPPSAKGDRAVLGAVTGVGAAGVVAALDAGELGDLGLHHLGHHLQPDRGRRGEQPLTHMLGESGEMAVDRPGELGWQPPLGGRDQLQATVTVVVVAGRGGRVRT
jgi:hypothetical protein